MKDQTGQEIAVGQTLAISVERGLRIGEVVDVYPCAIRLKVDSVSRPGRMAKIMYTRPHRARIIAQPARVPDILKPIEEQKA
jgi:hypothetical protein